MLRLNQVLNRERVLWVRPETEGLEVKIINMGFGFGLGVSEYPEILDFQYPERPQRKGPESHSITRPMGFKYAISELKVDFVLISEISLRAKG